MESQKLNFPILQTGFHCKQIMEIKALIFASWRLILIADNGKITSGMDGVIL